MAQRFKLGVQRGVIVTDVTDNSLAMSVALFRFKPGTQEIVK